MSGDTDIMASIVRDDGGTVEVITVARAVAFLPAAAVSVPLLMGGGEGTPTLTGTYVEPNVTSRMAVDLTIATSIMVVVSVGSAPPPVARCRIEFSADGGTTWAPVGATVDVAARLDGPDNTVHYDGGFVAIADAAKRLVVLRATVAGSGGGSATLIHVVCQVA